jgi:hypothetical protein
MLSYQLDSVLCVLINPMLTLRPCREKPGYRRTNVGLYFVRFEALRTAIMTKIAFWNIAPCIKVKVYRRFRSTYCLHHRSDDRGSTRLRNVCLLQRDYTALYYRKLTSSMKIPSLKRALDPLLRNASLLGQLGSTVCGRELVKNATY